MFKYTRRKYYLLNCWLVKFYALSSLLVLFVLSTSAHAQVDTIEQSKPNILVLGDSLSAAYGIDIEDGWVVLLQTKLDAQAKVVNASISGETSGGGLRALPSLLAEHQPAIVIIELGANDALRGFPLAHIEANLAQLVQLSKQAGSRVLLIGNHIPPNYGKAYALGFHELYTKIAKHYGVALTNFMLEGVAVNPELMQADGLHPTASAQPQILKNIWPDLAPLL